MFKKVDETEQGLEAAHREMLESARAHVEAIDVCAELIARVRQTEPNRSHWVLSDQPALAERGPLIERRHAIAAWVARQDSRRVHRERRAEDERRRPAVNARRQAAARGGAA